MNSLSGVLKYLAYGSNMHPLRLRQRVPSCEPIGTAHLRGYRLHFHKNGRDGSGKCSITRTERMSDRIIGVVYEMHAAERHLLDKAEGLGAGYDLASLKVSCRGVLQQVFCYVADPAHVDETLRPYDWYKALVVGGAHAHRLPADYIRELNQVQAVADPNAARASLHFGIAEATA